MLLLPIDLQHPGLGKPDHRFLSQPTEVSILAIDSHGWAISEVGLDPFINLLLGSSGISKFFFGKYVFLIQDTCRGEFLKLRKVQCEPKQQMISYCFDTRVGEACSSDALCQTDTREIWP